MKLNYISCQMKKKFNTVYLNVKNSIQNAYSQSIYRVKSEPEIKIHITFV